MNKVAKYNPPADAIEALARCLYPAMVAYFESKEGQREFAEWQSKRDETNLPAGETKSGKESGRAA